MNLARRHRFGSRSSSAVASDFACNEVRTQLQKTGSVDIFRERPPLPISGLFEEIENWHQARQIGVGGFPPTVFTAVIKKVVEQLAGRQF